MVEDFSDHPLSVAEIRSDRSQNAKDWTARDALIAVLRRIDSGELDLEAVVIAGRIGGGAAPGTTWTVASPDIHITLGLLARITYVINATAEGAE